MPSTEQQSIAVLRDRLPGISRTLDAVADAVVKLKPPDDDPERLDEWHNALKNLVLTSKNTARLTRHVEVLAVLADHDAALTARVMSPGDEDPVRTARDVGWPW